MKRYFIAKPNTGFKEGTICTLEPEDDFGEECGGVYEGTYIVGSCGDDEEDYDPYHGYDKLWLDKGYKVGDEVVMRELCSHDEFNEVYPYKAKDIDPDHFMIVDKFMVNGKEVDSFKDMLNGSKEE